MFKHAYGSTGRLRLSGEVMLFEVYRSECRNAAFVEDCANLCTTPCHTSILGMLAPAAAGWPMHA